MGLEPHDIRKLLALRAAHPDGTAALILGDCHFYFDRTLLGFPDGGPVTLRDVGQALGFTRLETVDLSGHPTIRLDLHGDVPADLVGAFDWILDAGTLFCCFNVPKVLANILRMLTPQGYVFHLAGLAGYLGRSYYALSPMFFRDFYTQNGFDVLEMGVRVKPRHLQQRWWRGAVDLDWQPMGTSDTFVATASATDLTFRASYHDEPDVLPNNALVMCFAQRRMVRPFTDAIPGYYERP